jgi:hypothetical protein
VTKQGKLSLRAADGGVTGAVAPGGMFTVYVADPPAPAPTSRWGSS